MDFKYIFFILELIGTIAFASSGTMIGIKKDMDIFGITILSIITAIGGGIIRDIFLGILPPTAFYKIIYVIIAILTTIILIFSLSNKINECANYFADLFTKIICVLDAIGLAIFTVNGILLAVNNGHKNPFLLIFVGVSTGCGGGVIRDIFSSEIPSILTKNTIYAVSSIIGAILYILTYKKLGNIAFILSASIIFLVRIIAMKYKLKLPGITNKKIKIKK